MEMKRLNLILGVLAAMILIISCAAFAYTMIPKGDTTKVVVNDTEYLRVELFNDFEQTSFTASDQSFEGIRLSDLVNDTGLSDPASYQYKIIGADGYQKDVSWNDMLNGYLVEEENKSVFPELTQQFWVTDIITIEVI